MSEWHRKRGVPFRPILLLPGLLMLALLAQMLRSPHSLTAQQVAPKGNVSNGIIIYQQRCANCHGPLGMGDGELAANLPNPVPAIGSAAYAQAGIPDVMYEVISNGRIENGMPPFGEGTSNALTEQERWDVIASLYALSSSAENLIELDATLPDDIREQLAAVDWQSSTNAAVAGKLDAPDLAADEVAGAVNWGRLKYSADYFLGPGSVSGSVLNGTTNQALTSGEVSLIAFEGFDRATTFSAEIDTDGSYEVSFDNVPADWFLRPEVAHDGVAYVGQFLRFEPTAMTQESAVTVYDATSNDGGIRLTFLNTVLEFAPDTLVINQLYAFDNINNQTYVGGMEYRVPVSAENVSYSAIENGQFAPIQLSATGLDQTPVLPGQSVLNTFIRYTIPYDGEATIEHALNHAPIQAALAVPEGIEVNAPWTYRNSDEVEGQNFDNYSAEFEDTFRLSLGGNPQFAVDPNSGGRVLVRDEQQELIIGAVGLLIACIVSLLVVRKWQSQPSTDAGPLLSEIAALDDAYAAKKINRKAYQQKRQVLMQKVRDIWESAKG